MCNVCVMYKVVYTKRKFKSEDKYEIIQSQKFIFVFIFAFEFTFCIYYFIHNTHVTHILSLKKNGLPVRNIGITKYFLPSICCVVILICSFLILSMGYILSQ